ncbi:MAG: hypothetical protein OXC82_05175 [Rhodobacteraceae bacterium]|nr:hypothetical protein [Paracoccaceae bacterium]MCY4249814.1 hypothetical protein [Paracoccaceae bacterium]MCY4308663.1 hypothetical protein [Paracoccaceae bacterium]
MKEPTQTELLEIYKLHAELADRVSQRREVANRLYISLLSGLVFFVGIFADLGIIDSHPKIIFVGIAMLGVIISLSWLVVIRSYRQLNSGKFKVLDELEDMIAFPFFRREWEILEKGEKPSRYWKLTTVETFLPIIFCLLFGGFIVMMLFF